MAPVGCRLDAAPFDGDELALHAEQSLDGVLGLLVASFAEVVVADDACGVDEIEGRPVVVVERVPDAVVVVHRDRVTDPSLCDRGADAVDLVFERELRCVDPDDDESVVAVVRPLRIAVSDLSTLTRSNRALAPSARQDYAPLKQHDVFCWFPSTQATASAQLRDCGQPPSPTTMTRAEAPGEHGPLTSRGAHPKGLSCRFSSS